MELYGEKSKSIPQKLLIHVLEVIFIWLAYWILFGSGGASIQREFHIHDATGALERRVVIFSFIMIAFFRLGFMMIYLLKRKIPWEESVSVPMAFALYYLGYTIMVLPTGKSVDLLDGLGIFIFLTGSFINTYGEILRDKWKKKQQNKGRLYTQGVFKHVRHINYFGDLLWVTGFAILTRNWYASIIPVFLFCFFAFYNIPKLDAYLHRKYGKEYEQYAERTWKLIPMIY